MVITAWSDPSFWFQFQIKWGNERHRQSSCTTVSFSTVLGVSYVICFTLLWLFFCFFELLRKDPLVYPALFLNGCGWMRRWLICCYFIKMAEKLIFSFVFLQILKIFIIALCDTLIGLSLIIVVFWFLNSCEENSWGGM